MQVHSFLKAWELLEGEWEQDGKQRIIIYEPLKTDLPENVIPWCGYSNSVIFYDEKYRELDRIEPRLLYNEYLLVGRVWYEMGCGKAIYRNGQWTMSRYGYKNTRKAIMLNEGFKNWNK